MNVLRSYPFLYLLGAALSIAVYVSFSTPIAGYFGDAVQYKMNGTAVAAPVKAVLVKESYDSLGVVYIDAKDFAGIRQPVRISQTNELKVGDVFVADISYDPPTQSYTLVQVVRRNPMMTFALIPGLGELGRNLLFHVPMSMVAFLAFLIGTIYSILYLVKKKPDYDRSARASSAVGLMFTLLSTITGSVWARFSWGTFWNWDPREVSIFILLLIYFAYFILRSLLEESEEKKARIAAVYNIIAFVSVPFLMFVVPRITQSLHPGGGGGEAPIINTSATPVHTDPTLLNMHWLNVLLFILVFLWLKDLYTRVLRIEDARTESLS